MSVTKYKCLISRNTMIPQEIGEIWLFRGDVIKNGEYVLSYNASGLSFPYTESGASEAAYLTDGLFDVNATYLSLSQYQTKLQNLGMNHVIYFPKQWFKTTAFRR